MDRRRKIIESGRPASSSSRPRSAGKVQGQKPNPIVKRKNSFGSTTATSTPRRVSSSSRYPSSSDHGNPSTPTAPSDRVSMLVIEANEIAQYLQKEYEFSKIDVSPKNESDAEIKVTNTKLKISCVWKLPKLKERLQRMRKLMYQAEPGIISDEVFYDPKDSWTREGLCKDISPDDRPIDRPQVASPDHKKGSDTDHSTSFEEFPVKDTSSSSARPASLQSTEGKELPGDSQFFMALSTPTTPIKGSSAFIDASGKQAESFLPEKYLRSNHSPPERDTNSQQNALTTPRSLHSRGSPPLRNRNIFGSGPGATMSGSPQRPPTKLSLKPAGPPKPRVVSPWAVTRKVLAYTVQRLKDWHKELSLVDHVLRDCESLKLATVYILERCSSDKTESKSQDNEELEHSHLISLQLVASLELLSTHTSLWCSSLLEAIDSQEIANLSKSLEVTIAGIGAELATLLQACDEKNESAVQDSATKVLDLVYDLGKFSGELAICTDTRVSCLKDTDSTVNIEDLMKVTDDNADLLKSRPASDVKQACLTGADQYVDQTLGSALKGIKQSECEMQNLSTGLQDSSKCVLELLKHADILTATTKILILRCQEVQMQMDACMKEVYQEKPTNFFYHFYIRCQNVISHVGSLADSVTYLSRALTPLSQGPDDGTMRQVCRCCEMVKKAACKLAGLPADLTLGGSGADLKLIMQGMSILTDHQKAHLVSAAEEVKMAADSLSNRAKKQIGDNTTMNGGNSSQKARRMLPVTPAGSVVKRPVRSHSARGSAPNRRSMPVFPIDDHCVPQQNGAYS